MRRPVVLAAVTLTLFTATLITALVACSNESADAAAELGVEPGLREVPAEPRRPPQPPNPDLVSEEAAGAGGDEQD